MERLTKRFSDNGIGYEVLGDYYSICALASLTSSNDKEDSEAAYEKLQEISEKFANYEEKQEQGLMIELKAKPKDRVYVDYCGEVTEATVISFNIENAKYMSGTYRLYIDPDTEKEVDAEDVYLTEAEAEAALDTQSALAEMSKRWGEQEVTYCQTLEMLH